VYAVHTSHVGGKAGLVVGDRRSLQVDAGKSISEGASISATIGGADLRADSLVYTHGHWDHVRGGAQFAGEDVIAQIAALPMIENELATARAEHDENARPDAPPTRGRSLGQPTIAAGGELRLDLGGREAQVLDTPGHAPGAICVFLPEMGVLFGGDTVVTAIPPVFRDGDSMALQASLRHLATLPLEVLIPGHGDVVRGRSAIRAAIEWSADYLARVRDHVSAQIDTRSPDEIVAGATFAGFIADRLPPDRDRMLWRHEQTVRCMISELIRA
jgi:glyoxylase-like metal-dependent hydrolase (beta-lactamase superfamily II)